MFTLKVKMMAAIVFVAGFVILQSAGGGLFGKAVAGGFQWGNPSGQSTHVAVYS